MKKSPPQTSSPHLIPKTFIRPILCLILALLVHTTVLVNVRAGNFLANFNSGLVPVGTTNYGSATVTATGGAGDSGVLRLTTAVASQTGSLVIDDLDSGAAVVSFIASFKARVGGGNGADGFSFNFASDLPDAVFNELGAGTGLTISFDTFDNGGGEAPAVEALYSGGSVTNALAGILRTGARFVEVIVKVDPDGTLDVTYDGHTLINNLLVYTTPIAGRFGFGARTGSNTDNHFVDDVSISTKTAASAYIESLAPLGPNIRPDAVVKIVLTDSGTTVDTNKIQLFFDAGDVTSGANITQDGANTTITYDPPGLLVSNSAHTVSVTFADNVPTTNTFSYAFTISAYRTLATNLATAPGVVNTGTEGFRTRISQVADDLGNTVSRAEQQLAGLLTNSATALPYDNLATPNPEESNFVYNITNVINFDQAGLGGLSGNFTPDEAIPGIPGITASDDYIALDAVTYLDLVPGIYTLGVNSDAGFRLTAAESADVFATEIGVFDGPRTAQDSTMTFQVTQAGIYPFRLLWFAGVGPASVEWFSVDANGNKILINDTNTPGHIKGYRVATTRPYVQSASPAPNESSVPGNTTISLTLVDGDLSVQTGSIQLSFNGTLVSHGSASASGITTITYNPPGDLPPNSTNSVRLVFTDSGANTRTNEYQFFAANILQQIFYLAPGSAPYITPPPAPGNTERGLAYNPKTGNVLLVSRAAAVGGLEIEVLSNASGAKIGTLDASGIATGPGLFKLNLIDVADDGVIYGCNLTTDSSVAANPFAIYRWASENAAPTLAYSGNPAGAGLRMRLGDTFRVRRSGAGTQIIATENTGLSPGIGGTNAMLFTTVDGTNFTVTRIAVPGIANGDIRLGLAFGCGNTFYGAVTAAGNSQMRYVTFNPFTGAASLTATYLLNNQGVATVGPLGVDLFNQRVIGNATSGTAGEPHSMNLYDLSSLTATPSGTNFVLDRRVFGTANAAFGTGAIDFTPNGDRLYTLDTANGVLAFSLAPKPAAPIICNPPLSRTNRIGQTAFFGVEASGSEQKFQWRFNGVNLSGQTNATLDIYNVQLGHAGNYDVVITNTLGSVTSSPSARLYVSVTVLTQPESQLLPVGGTTNFSVTVNGESPITYQWRHNGTDILGATNASLTITNAQPADAGSYTVVISNPAGSVTSAVASLTVGTLGTGTGLTGDYYSSQLQTFVGPPTLTRLDSTVDFDFLTDSPDGSITADLFKVRWTGKIEPLYSQTYTFYTTTDDGVRLWINGQLVINSWINQAPTERTGSIALTAYQKYDITMEYFENTGGAVARLSWSSPGQVKQIIPQTQLYPGASPVQPLLATSLRNGNELILHWGGTFQLESSTNVAGPYSPVLGITNSPFTNIIGLDPEMYFRLLNQY